MTARCSRALESPRARARRIFFAASVQAASESEQLRRPSLPRRRAPPRFSTCARPYSSLTSPARLDCRRCATAAVAASGRACSTRSGLHWRYRGRGRPSALFTPSARCRDPTGTPTRAATLTSAARVRLRGCRAAVRRRPGRTGRGHLVPTRSRPKGTFKSSCALHLGRARTSHAHLCRLPRRRGHRQGQGPQDGRPSCSHRRPVPAQGAGAHLPQEMRCRVRRLAHVLQRARWSPLRSCGSWRAGSARFVGRV